MQLHAKATQTLFAVATSVFILGIAGCGSSRVPEVFGLGGSLINIVPASSGFQQSPRATAMATCPSSQQLLGGGFLLSGEDASASAGGSITVDQNFPSSTTTWVVSATAEGSTNQAVLALAYCYAPASPRLNISLQSAITAPAGRLPLGSIIASTSGQTNCPAGSVLTGGGYKVTSKPPPAYAYNSYISFSGPVQNASVDGWQVGLTYDGGVSPQAEVYALCAEANLAPGKPPTITAGTVCACPAGYFSTAGGFSVTPALPTTVTPYNILSTYAGSQVSWAVTQEKGPPPHFGVIPVQLGTWQVTMQGLAAPSITAYCLKFPSGS